MSDFAFFYIIPVLIDYAPCCCISYSRLETKEQTPSAPRGNRGGLGLHSLNTSLDGIGGGCPATATGLQARQPEGS